MIRYLPFVGAVVLVGALLAPAVSRRVDLLVSRVALALFGDYVADRSPRKQDQRDLMRAAHTGGTHRVYASRTLLYAGVLGVVGSIVGVYLAAGVLTLLAVSTEALANILPPQLNFLSNLARLSEVGFAELFALLAFSSATVGAGLGLATYYARWEVLNQRSVARASAIDTTLPRTVAFIYALSRSGMAFPQVMNTLARNQEVYGEAAAELSVAVRDMNTFGTDALTALQRTAQRTPSEDLSEFAENLASVLGSGQSLSAFLEDQYERYQEEAEAKQEQYLELLSTFAEAYVTALVAGPLFLITILVVIGLVLEDTLPLLRVIVYLGIPLATLGFIVYVDSVTQGVDSNERVDLDEVPDADAEFTLPDGGTTADDRWRVSRERLAAHDWFDDVLGWVTTPVETILGRPSTVFVISVPLGAAWVAATALPVPVTEPTRMVAAVEGAAVQAATFVLASYAIVYEIEKRRTRGIEATVPDFLDRLASINEAGTSVVESFRRVTDSDLADLTPELVRTWRDIQWGADVSSALGRLERRVESPLVSRSVALITNAMRASGDIGPVLRISADEARATRKLRRERRQVMMTYLIVIYISFLVFLGIIAALTVSFIPAIEDAEIANGVGDIGGGVGGGITEGLGDIDVFAYEQLFYHAAAIQAVCSGLVAGQLGAGSVRDGVKHAVILLVLASVAFVVMDLV
ncbi:type II secretion system F family protein [Halorubrum gandharaense]